MKKLKFFLLLGLVHFLFSGCKTEDEPEIEPTGYFMEAKIDGTIWKSSIGGFLGGSVQTALGTLTTIGGYGTDNDSQLVIILPFNINDTEEKSYEINDAFSLTKEVTANYSPTFFSSGGLGVTFYSTSSSGTLTITEYDEQNGVLAGTFVLTAEADDNVSPMITITEGKFNLPIE